MRPIDHRQGRVAGGKREKTTHEEEPHNWKSFRWVKGLLITLVHFLHTPENSDSIEVLRPMTGEAFFFLLTERWEDKG